MKRGAAQQGDEADEAKHIGASQLIPSVGRTYTRAQRWNSGERPR